MSIGSAVPAAVAPEPGDRQQIGMILVHPLERFGQPQISLAGAYGGNIGGRGRFRSGPGAGVERPPRAVANKKD